VLQAAAFNGSEAALVTDDIDGVALHCRGRRYKVRGGPIWMERECTVVLIDDGRRWPCSGRNQRGGGVSGGGSRRGRHISGGDGGELELGRGRGTERSEATSFSEVHLQRTLGLSVLGLEQFQDG
jgi:hypothetical protein